MEESLGERAEAALGTQETDDSGSLFVEAGLERVADGFHTEPELTRGHTYTLAVACVGQGRVSLTLAPEATGRRTVDCDGVPYRLDITASSARIRIGTDAMPGASGMVAWRLDRADTRSG